MGRGASQIRGRGRARSRGTVGLEKLRQLNFKALCLKPNIPNPSHRSSRKSRIEQQSAYICSSDAKGHREKMDIGDRSCNPASREPWISNLGQLQNRTSPKPPVQAASPVIEKDH